MRKFIPLLLLTAFLSMPLHAQRQNERAKLQIAGSQYEIITALIQNQEYSRIIGEYRQILSLDLSAENEMPLVQATVQIVRALRQAGQYSLASQMVDEALPKVRLSESKYPLLMSKGMVLKDQGKFEEAIEIYRKAQHFAPALTAPEK
ncbi:MAG: hypothetical protein EHM61_05520 [Acidobacteria bacterium]|nr:MAG: hypothetical protein EHM61_05520 [Acidobacteriota bacterium]